MHIYNCLHFSVVLSNYWDVRPYSVDCQVPLDAKHYARTCGRFKGVVGQAVTETLAN